MTKKPKLILSIKGKLISAACMLLVAVIMVVSSTYAWFTLSTAPEVSGISTAVGANGALEMALYTGTVNDGVLPSNATQVDKNTYWGNLVDLSNGYGLDEITLYPSVLNLSGTTIPASPLKTPAYGADGRVSDLLTNAQTGTWDSTEEAFFPGAELGVRGVGAASGMTPRQLSYRNARSAASTAMSTARNLAAQSLNTNGSALANIAIKHGMKAENESYSQTDVASLRAIIDDLNGEGGILDQIETAYMQYILAYAASNATNETIDNGDGTQTTTVNDSVWEVVSGAVSADGATLDSVVTAIGAYLPIEVSTAIDAYIETVDDVADAETALKALEDEGADATFTWTKISTPLTLLANPEAMIINNEINASEVNTKLGDLVSLVTSQGGLTVTMATGGGVYADIADQCGDYTASVTINKVEYNGITLNNMTARMETKSTQTTSYLSAIGTAVGIAGTPIAPTGEGASKMPITEFYGYILDLAFRTNAAESNLLLQTEATDRIYSNNAENNDADDDNNTWGHGSTMTFKSTDTNFSNDQVIALMKNLRIVFFTPDENGINTGTVLAYAKLDLSETKDANGNVTSAAYTIGADGFTANIYLTDADGTVRTGDDANVITAMTQNATVKVSALVYLDGTTITNADVAATVATSMTGKMNLQFSSSADLQPMEYADLHQASGTSTPAAGGTGSENGGEVAGGEGAGN